MDRLPPCAYIHGMTSIDPRTIALGKEIRGEAAANGVTIRDLAARAHVDRSTLYKYLDGQRAMPITTLMAIASVLRVLPYELLRRAEERARRDVKEV